MPLSHPQLPQIVQYLHKRIPSPPQVAVVLGSGLGALTQSVQPELVIPYEQIPGFFRTRIPGHLGKLIVGTLAGRCVVMFSGRVHLYEGYSFSEVTLSVQIAHALGARAVALSSSVGSVNPSYEPGDFMLIADHINLQSGNPILEMVSQSQSNPFTESPSPFVDLCGTYRTDVFKPLAGLATEHGSRLHRGVLCAVLGPLYETPAEVRMLQILGADAVCMSTVPEAIMARYLGLEVGGLASITNAAHLQKDKGPSHDEVLAASHKSSGPFVALMEKLIQLL